MREVEIEELAELMMRLSNCVREKTFLCAVFCQLFSVSGPNLVRSLRFL
jgi:hypothetical protein